MHIYEELGLRPVINCATTYTRIGGSIMAPHVAQAMADASGCYVNLSDLQSAVGQRIALRTGNDAAYVTSGAAAGIALATAACITGDDLRAMDRLPNDLTGLKQEIVIQRNQRNGYDRAIRQTGAHLIEVGQPDGTTVDELEAAITARTAAVFYFAGSHLNRNTLSLPQVITVAHRRGVPVVVDAAAQIPPTSNLWHFTRELGADLAIFSGGKWLAGPQNSGLVVGRADLIRAIALNGPPHQRLGRPMKVSKETMIGLLTAVEHALALDFDALLTGWNQTLTAWHLCWADAAPVGITIERGDTGEAGEPVPRLLIHFSDAAPLDRNPVVVALGAGDPAIDVVVDGERTIALSAHLLQGDEAAIVRDRVVEILAGATVPDDIPAHPVAAGVV